MFNIRTTMPMLQSNLLFHVSSYGAEQRQSLKILHGFTDCVSLFLIHGKYYIDSSLLYPNR